MLCRIENRIYKCIAGDLMTDEVIITDRQAAHSNEDHSSAFEKYGGEIPRILADPDLIFEDKRPFSGLVVGRIRIEGKNLAIALRIRVASDPEGYKNSVITCWDIGEDRLEIYRRNRKILYMRPKV